MLKDDFDAFFEDRKEQILKRIESAMGKTISRDVQVFEEGKFVDEESEDLDYPEVLESHPYESRKPNTVVTNLMPVELVFNGRVIPVTYWTDVLRETLNALYDINVAKFDEFASQNPTHISKYPARFRFNRSIRGVYYADVNKAAQTIFNLCKRGVNHFGFGSDDWKVKTRAYK